MLLRALSRHPSLPLLSRRGLLYASGTGFHVRLRGETRSRPKHQGVQGRKHERPASVGRIVGRAHL
jgi:hypothetical protein